MSSVDHLAESEDIAAKRRMPANIRAQCIKMQGQKWYLQVAHRLVWFRDEMGDDWGIRTELIEGGHEAGFATVKAEIVNPAGFTVSMGHKTESKQDFAAGWVEKAESGAIGRALGALGFGTAFDHDVDAPGPHQRIADAPQGRTATSAPAPAPPQAPQRRTENTATAVARHMEANGQHYPGDIRPGLGQCPKCHAPEGKKHGKACLDGS